MLQKTDSELSEVFTSIEEYLPEVFEREWGVETFVARTPHYLGKTLRMKAGSRGGFQCHVDKDETFYLLWGEAQVEYDPGDGSIVTVPMKPGQSFRIPPKAPHRTTALTECFFIETSTPSYDDRFHCESYYGLDEETGGLPSTWDLVDGEFVRKGTHKNHPSRCWDRTCPACLKEAEE